MAKRIEIHGGEVWEQKKHPFFRCYLVFLGSSSWCRIQPPHEQGNIAWRDGRKWKYTTTEMVKLLTDLGYRLVGQYSDLHKAELEATWTRAIEYARTPVEPSGDETTHGR